MTQELGRIFLAGIREGFEKNGKNFDEWLNAPSTLHYVINMNKKTPRTPLMTENVQTPKPKPPQDVTDFFDQVTELRLWCDASKKVKKIVEDAYLFGHEEGRVMGWSDAMDAVNSNPQF